MGKTNGKVDTKSQNADRATNVKAKRGRFLPLASAGFSTVKTFSIGMDALMADIADDCIDVSRANSIVSASRAKLEAVKMQLKFSSQLENRRKVLQLNN